MSALTLKNTTEVVIYMFENKPFRVIGSLDNPQFVVKDICDILGLSNVTQATKSIPKEWFGDFNQIKDTGGRVQHMNTIYEPGLYHMIMRSDKEVAKPFQKWVCGEVLTSLRKKGEYVLEEYKQKLEEQQRLLEQKEAETKEQQKQLEAKEKTLQFKNELIQQTKKEADKYKVTYHQLAKTHDQLKFKRIYHKFKKGKCLYIVSDKWRKKLYYKFGETDDINQRLQNYRTSMPECRIEFLVYLNESEFLEKCVKYTYSKNLTSLNHEYVSGIPLLDLIADVKFFIKKLNFSATVEENLSSYNDPYSEEIVEQKNDTTIYDEKEPEEPIYDEKESTESTIVYDEKEQTEEFDIDEETDSECKEDQEISDIDEEAKQPEDISADILHKCDMCDASYRSHGKLITHRKKKHNIEDTTDYTVCPLCQKKFTNKGKMQRHVRSVHQKLTQVKCEECNSVFADKANLKAHIKQVHTKEAAIKCEQCGVVCTSKGNLERHIKFVHEKIKIPCIDCGKMIPPSNMKIHIDRVHKKLEASECTICHSILASKIGLKYHMMTQHKICS